MTALWTECRAGVLVLALLCTAAPLHGQDDEADVGRLLAGTQVVVVPFRNIAGGQDTNWIGEGIAEVLAADLAPTATVVAINRSVRSARSNRSGPADALALSRRAGARAPLLVGDLLGGSRSHRKVLRRWHLQGDEP